MLKVSEALFESVRDLWDETSRNPFITAMADGTLDRKLFKAYMLQDYYYLIDYTAILIQMQEQAAHTDTAAFLEKSVQATRNETESVHVPNMMQLGITSEEIRAGQKASACADYLQYLKETAQKGTIYGLTALLQCSWCYAYLAQTVAKRYGDSLEHSPYAGWFSAYTSDVYTEANAEWIAVLDRETQGISSEETEQLCSIFQRCAHYENGFWNCVLTSE
ncbi:MAG: hypothetical protein K5695_08560 [Oscillospiraceae bacterium]|nr:hypothetical protein [Oscillospiraceae bacterium]